ncbi:MAG: NAD(P)/FAD-dependent oxidoreductase [Rhizobiaceae bacterium]
MHDFGTTIIGAGVVGLAIARELAAKGQDVLVIEQHDIIGSETSARNSEVIHAGIYYPKDSLKARFCVEGKQMLYEHCKSFGVPHEQIGKLIVASNEEQTNALDSIQVHAANNGVKDLVMLDRASIKSLEPALDAVAGIYSPSTGIVDSHAFMLSLQGDAESNGAQIAFRTCLTGWTALNQGSGGFELECAGEEEMTITSQKLVLSAGLHNSNLCHQSSSILKDKVRPTRFAKGNYFRLSGRAPFSHLIYPVPEPGGLGVHLTLDMGKQARFGPDVEWVDSLDYEVDPARSAKFYAAIRAYWPGLPDDSLEPDYAGIRPKLSGPGEANADFEILGPGDLGLEGCVALLGIESPGLTASMAIAQHVRRILEV